MNPFRLLDERVLPRLARGLGRIADGLTRFGRGEGSGRRLLFGAATLSVIAVLATSLYLGSQPGPVDETVGDVVRVGAAEGVQVATYRKGAESELAGLLSRRTSDTYALVSFGSYQEPTLLSGLLAGVRTVQVYLRVPLPDVQTEIVSLPVNTLDTDVRAGMKRTADRKDRTAAESDRAAKGLGGDGQRERALRAFYQQDADVNRSEAEAYRRLCACAYAAVVVATPVRLKQLAGRAGVRVVDPAPEVRRLNRTVFLPLLPEQAVVVRPPRDRKLPAPG